MKVKMSEVFQGTGVEATLLYDGIKVSVLEKGKEYLVSDSLGAWLVENHKAEEIESVVIPGKIEEFIPVNDEPAPEFSEDEKVFEPKKRGRK